MKEKKSGLVIFLTIMAVVVGLALVALVSFIVFRIYKDEKAAKESATTETVLSADIEEVAEPATPAEPATATDADADEMARGYKLYKFERDGNSIHLPQADPTLAMNDANVDGETSENDEVPKGSSWDKNSLVLSPVEGSTNYASPGDASKTGMLTSSYMILVDLDEDRTVVERDADVVVSPASMTKVLTLLTARDHIDESNLDDKFTITAEICEYVNKNNASAVGFQPDDEVTVSDLLYGTILCSGADAALGLAEYCCGSEEAFVEEMNKKCEELEISDTAHFTNVVGMYDPDLHCTMRDMAIIMSVAVQDDMCLDILSKHTYLTSITTEDWPDGIEISNWFLRRIEDKYTDGEVVAAKTGFVNESGCCAVSYYVSNNGKRYICVTGNAFSTWRSIYDHVGVYRSYTQKD